MTITGPDVSNHQGAVDWRAVKAAGHDFAIVKATEGVVFTDPLLQANRRGAHEAGLIVGFYHYAGSSYYRRIYDPVAEADFFASALGGLQPGEFIVLDFEPVGFLPADVPGWSLAWLDRAQARLGPTPMIYLNQWFRDSFDWSRVVADDDALWLAAYDWSQSPLSPGRWSGLAMKQFTDKATVPGVGGPVDLNVFYGTREQLLAYGKGGSPTPTPGDDMPLTLDDFKLLFYNTTFRTYPDGSSVNLATFLHNLDDAQRAEKARVDSLFDAVFTGGTSMADGGKSISQSLADIKAAAADPKALAEAVVTAMGAEFAGKVIDALGERIKPTQPAPPAA